MLKSRNPISDQTKKNLPVVKQREHKNQNKLKVHFQELLITKVKKIAGFKRQFKHKLAFQMAGDCKAFTAF